jgi:hypothetical protein
MKNCCPTFKTLVPFEQFKKTLFKNKEGGTRCTLTKMQTSPLFNKSPVCPVIVKIIGFYGLLRFITSTWVRF